MKLIFKLTHFTNILLIPWKGSDKVIASVKICNMGGTYLSLHLSEMALPFHDPHHKSFVDGPRNKVVTMEIFLALFRESLCHVC